MQNIDDALIIAWNYKVSFLPVLLAYFIFDIPLFVRQITKKYYVPMYFIIFPLGHSDSLYAEYFNEDYMFGNGERMNDKQKIQLKHRLMAYAVISMVFACVISPYLCGVISALYLTTDQFEEFFIVLAAIKSLLLLRSLIRSSYESALFRIFLNKILLACMYILYLIFALFSVRRAFLWSTEKINDSETGLIYAIIDFIYNDMIISILVVGGVTWAIQYILTNDKNIQKHIEFNE